MLTACFAFAFLWYVPYVFPTFLNQLSISGVNCSHLFNDYGMCQRWIYRLYGWTI